MREGLVSELRALLGRSWPLWILPPLAAYLGWRLLPYNAHLYETVIDFDPQPDGAVLAAYRTDAMAVYTSGFGCGCLLAMAAGVFLVLRDPRLAGRRAVREVPDPDPPPGAPAPVVLIFAKAAVAALFAVVLAAADMAAALPTAAAHVAGHWGLGELASRGVAVHQLTLADRPVWTVVASGAAGFAAWAVLGVGLGAMIGRWRRLAAFAGGYVVLGGLLYLAAWLAGQPASRCLVAALFPLAVPAVVWAVFWIVALSAWAPAAVAATAVAAVCLLALGHQSTQRRLAAA
ncbi:MAG: hypothetical protein V7603_6315 [Micromonosporaceae bacterium]